MKNEQIASQEMRAKLVAVARERYITADTIGNMRIDDTAKILGSPFGAWVSAYVYVQDYDVIGQGSALRTKEKTS